MIPADLSENSNLDNCEVWESLKRQWESLKCKISNPNWQISLTSSVLLYTPLITVNVHCETPTNSIQTPMWYISGDDYSPHLSYLCKSCYILVRCTTTNRVWSDDNEHPEEAVTVRIWAHSPGPINQQARFENCRSRLKFPGHDQSTIIVLCLHNIPEINI